MERGQGQAGVSDRPLSDFLPCDSELSEDAHEAPDVRLLPSLLNPPTQNHPMNQPNSKYTIKIDCIGHYVSCSHWGLFRAGPYGA